jgi:hypothetical protein
VGGRAVALTKPIAIFLLVGSLLRAEGESVATTLFAMPRGRRVDVVMAGGGKFTGRVGEVRPFDFTLDPDGPGKPARAIAYRDVRQVRERLTTGNKWMLAGVVYLVLAGIGIALGG